MISGDVVTTVKVCLADVIANVVMLLLLVRACLGDVIANVCGCCCCHFCFIDMVIAEDIVVPVADVIATNWLLFG